MVKAAAVQMTAKLGDVETNLAAAGRLASEAFRDGAELVILPEFFTSAVAYHPSMKNAARPIDGEPARLLKDLAREFDGIVGGSFVARRGKDNYNTFVLALPDGSTYTHDKDMPTMWENCYYRGGSDDGVLETPFGKFGVALCWEFVRSGTARRLAGRVDAVIGGSCWWDLPDRRLPGFSKKIAARNLEIMIDTPGRFARILGVPVVHAAHAGDFTCKLPLVPGFRYESFFLGETQIVDARGNILAQMTKSDGEGFITADIDLSEKCDSPENIPNRFWIPDIPAQIRFVWHYQNLHGKILYRLTGRK